jgi:hypothetical protein
MPIAPTPSTSPPYPVEPGTVLIAWGQPERLALISADKLIDTLRRGQKKFTIDLVSPIVGVVHSITVTERYIVVTASDHRQFVRLHRDDLSKYDVLSPIPHLHTDPESTADYGAPVRYGNELIFGVDISQNNESRIGIIRVDVNEWKLRQTVIYKDRFAAAPRMCMTADGTLALEASRSLGKDDELQDMIDLIDPSTLARRDSIPYPGNSWDMVCVGNQIWVGEDRPRGAVFTSKGRLLGRFRWQGQGQVDLLPSPDQKRVYGTDERTGVLFSCKVSSRRCKTGRVVGSRPDSLLVIEPYILVAAWVSKELVLVDAKTLQILGRLKFPGDPLALALAS